MSIIGPVVAFLIITGIAVLNTYTVQTRGLAGLLSVSILYLIIIAFVYYIQEDRSGENFSQKIFSFLGIMLIYLPVALLAAAGAYIGHKNNFPFMVKSMMSLTGGFGGMFLIRYMLQLIEYISDRIN